MIEEKLRAHRIEAFSIKDIELTRDYNLIYHKNKYISSVMQDFIDNIRKLEESYHNRS